MKRIILIICMLIATSAFAETKYDQCRWVGNVMKALAIRHNQGIPPQYLVEAALELMPKYEQYLVKSGNLKTDFMIKRLEGEDEQHDPQMWKEVMMDVCFKT